MSHLGVYRLPSPQVLAGTDFCPGDVLFLGILFFICVCLCMLEGVDTQMLFSYFSLVLKGTAWILFTNLSAFEYP